MEKDTELRPPISGITSSAELKRWYWLKDELIAQARILGLRRAGGKFTLLERIAHYLDTGSLVWPGDRTKKISSQFSLQRMYAEYGP